MASLYQIDKRRKLAQKSKNKIIRFEEMFEPTLKKRLQIFLESGKISAQLTKALLITAFLGGILFIGATAPNLFSALGKMGLGRKPKITKEGFKELKQSFYQLRRLKLIEFVKSEGETDIYRVSTKGKTMLQKYTFEKLVVPKPKQWDGNWRIVLFDIPHSKRAARNALRRKLREMEFFQFQKSAWVYPFPCEKEIFFVAKVFNISQYLEVFTIKNFNDIRALKFFKNLLEDFMN